MSATDFTMEEAASLMMQLRAMNHEHEIIAALKRLNGGELPSVDEVMQGKPNIAIHPDGRRLLSWNGKATPLSRQRGEALQR